MTQHTAGLTKAYHIRDAFKRLAIGPTTGAKIVKEGALQTFTIGRFRYCTDEALREYIEARIADSANETSDERARKVRAAVAGRAEKRSQVAA